jgi:hypothetical protein
MHSSDEPKRRSLPPVLRLLHDDGLPLGAASRRVTAPHEPGAVALAVADRGFASSSDGELLRHHARIQRQLRAAIGASRISA